MKHLFSSAPRNGLYISPDTQDEVINLCGEIIQGVLRAKINLGKYCSIVADETTALVGVEQMLLCIRYIEKEDFLGYAPLIDTTWESIARKH